MELKIDHFILFQKKLIIKSNMKYELKRLEWDSNFFDLKIAEIRVEGNNDEFIIEKIKEFSYDLVYLFSKKEITNVLTLNVIDLKRIYIKSIDKNSKYNIDENVVSYRGSINNQLQQLVLDAGSFSRFKIDKNLNNNFKKMYETWLRKSILREIADEVYVYKKDNNIYGFVTIKKNNQQATIGLIAVDNQKQNKGIGRKLIYAVEKWAIDQKLDKISVATQQQNIKACNFYSKMGFEIYDEEYIYHIWNENSLL